MTSSVASKAERLVSQRLKAHIQAASLIASISPAQIAGVVPAVLTERLSAPRFRARLERRFIRKTNLADALPVLFESPAESIIAHGEYGLQALIIDTGIVCHNVALRRIVDSASLSELSKLLGVALDTHDARIVRSSDSLTIAQLIGAQSPDGIEPLAASILHDGLQCWTCWIHRQPEPLHGFFHQLTPPSLGVDDVWNDAKCMRRECRHRAALFDARRMLVADANDTPVRRKA